MGIGNVSATTTSKSCSGALITPHGDRKLVAVAAPPEPEPPDSLPLMGIGNLQQTTFGARTSHSTHYPSWGSETGGRSADDAKSHALLITPHGDRKLGRRPTHEYPPSPHYPSWGSETGAEGRRRAPGPVLITPHGDRKPDRDGWRAGVALAGSLPLMGIGNPGHRPGHVRQALPLITPHGDRKHYSADQAVRIGWASEHSLPLMGIGNAAT